MIFNSIDYFIFFALFYIFYLQFNHRKQNYLLLAGSYFFYGYWDVRFLLLLFISSLVDYTVGLKIQSTESERNKRLYLYLSILTNIGILGFFKYCNFFIDSAADLLQIIGLKPNLYSLQIILPLGISFYTFQTLSYTIDVYKQRVQPRKNFLDFALYVSFFPQLVAGPIERAERLLPQIEKKRVITYDYLEKGFFLILFGFFKKIFIADNLAYIVDPIFKEGSTPSGYEVVIGCYAFAFQIYGDFSGYSDIARGTAYLLGFQLIQNFRFPFLATNVSKFWSRWHISLMSWFRDYIFYPMGGSKVSKFRFHINNLTLFTLSGFWHGANLTFIFWGMYNALIASFYREIAPFLPSFKFKKKIIHLIGLVCITFFTFSINVSAIIFFRSVNIEQAFSYIGLVFTNFGSYEPKLLNSLLRSILFFAMIEIYQNKKKSEYAVFNLPIYVRTIIYIFCFYAILILGNFNKNEFIYFVF